MENATYQEGYAPAYAAPGMPMPGGLQPGYVPEADNGGCAGPAEAPGASGPVGPTGHVGPVGTPQAGQAMAAEGCAEAEKADEGQNRYMGQKPAQAPEQPPVQAQGPTQAQEGPKGYVSQGPSGYAKGYSQAPFQPEPPRAEAGLGQQYAYQGPQYAPQYGAPQPPQYAPQYGAPQPPQYAYQGPQAAPQSGAAQGPQYAYQGPQAAPQYGAPQGPQYAPQYGPAPGPEMGAGAPHDHEEGEGKKGHCHCRGGHGDHEEQAASQAQPGFFGFPGFGAGSPSEDPKHLEYRYGQMIELCNDLMQGKADPSKIAAFLTSTGTHFWKGALVGAAVTFVMTNSAVKSALGDTFSAIFGGAKSGGE